MVINKLLTTVNYEKMNNKQNKYIVIHFVGADGDAKDNCRYFEKVNRGASAHYFVGHKGDIWQCVEDKDAAWHCGTSENKYKHAYCRNGNSIGVELCCRKRNGAWYFEEATITSAIGLVKELMRKYNIPVENVIRHYDVTGKNCPAPFVKDVAAWNNFKSKLRECAEMAKDNKPNKYAEKAVEWAIKKGIIVGDTDGNLKLHENITRQDMLVFLYRAIGK